MSLFDTTFQFGELAERRPYLPSHAAHALDQHELVQPPQAVENPGSLISNGLIAGASNGGAISLSGVEWGFDFVAIEGDSKTLTLLPTDKGAVEVEDPNENIGFMRKEGAAILTHEDMVIVAGIVTVSAWLAEKARYEQSRVTQIAKDLWSILPMVPARAKMEDISAGGITHANWLSS